MAQISVQSTSHTANLGLNLISLSLLSSGVVDYKMFSQDINLNTCLSCQMQEVTTVYIIRELLKTCVHLPCHHDKPNTEYSSEYLQNSLR